MSTRVQTFVAVVLLIVAAIGVYIYALREPIQPAAMRTEQVVSIGKFTPVVPPRPAPAVNVTLIDGKGIHLADFKGKWLLLNLWATWCAPCIKEMPSLDRLSGKGMDKLAILAVSEDRDGQKVVAPFLGPLGIKSLMVATDTPGMVASALHVEGLPTSFLIDPEGRIMARLQGAAEWDDERTTKALNDLMTPKS